jgi:hypothetical protein
MTNPKITPSITYTDSNNCIVTSIVIDGADEYYNTFYCSDFEDVSLRQAFLVGVMHACTIFEKVLSEKNSQGSDETGQ